MASTYDSERVYRFANTGVPSKLQRDAAYAIAKQRLEGDTLTQCRFFIYGRRIRVWQLRQLMERWGAEMPMDFLSEKR
jgi:hypothetical protein